ncbi:ribosomal L7Ae/L30e/S12e/Gadd45 family protein [Metallumcola ferriviriculae]|uniref:Ribosomal L7Ae/L30e/S12e/Gadd45 family protein n=1 Tax=Metallumcola ferriviriculae TaxID=3039180 RepID=A0AAU0UJ96_9FIRM|nr:ribosomal L7Ae/L30e/S12e/Gadd45 family protein [Desulfitibacteraceae bacterium MK1]
MPLETLRTAGNKTIGTKQTIKAVQKGLVQVVFVAEDADKQMVTSLTDLCHQNQVPVNRVPSMKELGEVCGIQVGAAAAAILK